MNRTRPSAFGESRTTLLDRVGTYLSRRRFKPLMIRGGDDVIADLGAGFHARLARDLAPFVDEVHVFDLSFGAELEKIPNMRLYRGDLLTQLRQVPAETYSAVCCISVLEHLDDDSEALRLMWRSLKPGGRLIINVPSWRGKWALEFAAFRLGLSPALEMDDHKRYYDPRDLWPKLVAAGFPPHSLRCRKHKFGLNTFAVCEKQPFLTE